MGVEWQNGSFEKPGIPSLGAACPVPNAPVCVREGYTPYDLQQYQGLNERALGFDVNGLLASRMTRREAEKKL